MKINYQRLYQKLGSLFYAIAMADKNIRHAEENKLTEQINSIWIPLDNSTDEFGTDAAQYIFIVFDHLHAEKAKADAAFNEFTSYYHEHKVIFDDAVKSKIMQTAEAISGAFFREEQNGINLPSATEAPAESMTENWHQLTTAQIFECLETNPSGLTQDDVEKRTVVHGLNVLLTEKPRSLWVVFLSQFKSLVVYLLVVATIISFLFGDYTEAVAILIVIFINAAIGFLLEAQALRSMSALKKLDRVFAKVIRKDTLREIPSEEIVPGDILYVEAGDIIAADARIYEAMQLEVNESPLTGESLPVSKTSHPLPDNTPLAERVNMLFKGTAIVRGNGRAIVVATGMNTELGQISAMVLSAKKEEIPLNEKLNSFSKKLIWLTILIVIPFLFVGMLEDRDLYLMIETAIALAVAAIPEGLPIVATISLASGMLKLTRYKVIVKKLAAVETLGETNVIFTDKTGTLTENDLVVNTICVPENSMELKWDDKQTSFELSPKNQTVQEKENMHRLIQIAVLCNNASFRNHKDQVGDPLEVALLKLAAGFKKEFIDTIRQNTTRIKEQPFDSETKIMGTLNKSGNDFLVTAKGAVEEILKLCAYVQTDNHVIPLSNEEKALWLKKTHELSHTGLRVLAFAYREMQQEEEKYMSNLVLTGLVGFFDPPRSDVPDAIKECKSAGIKVIMVTGDHPATARNISFKIGLTENVNEEVVHGQSICNVSSMNEKEKNDLEKVIIFSRVTPAQKLELVQLYQQKGNIVGMTGDGVNDAPALKKADIGIAMGRRGTQVAREAADMVLQNDAFPSIVKAIKQGRVIFNNIKTFIIYLLSCNLSEIFIVSVAAFANLALPLLPLQILFLNIVTDVFPALALGMGEGNPSIMQMPPRHPKEPLLIRSNWISIAVYAAAITVSVFSVFIYCHEYIGFSDEVCNNIAFLSLAFAQLLHPVNLIPAKEHFFRNDIMRNPHLWGAVAFCTALIIVIFFIPYTKDILSLQTLSHAAWLLIAIASVSPLVIIQIIKRLGLVD